MGKFKYDIKARMVQYNNCILDSLLELKLMLSIEETHALLRDDISIYYETEDFSETRIITDGLRKYTPDFLIRNWQTGIATLVEIKPADYDNQNVIQKRKDIAQNHIDYFAYDWNFKIIYGHQINLTQKQQALFDRITSSNKQNLFTLWPVQPVTSSNPYNLGIEQYRRYVLTGVLPAFHH